MTYTQENRLISIDTPLGDNVLLLQGFTGHEAISRLYNFQVDLLSKKENISFKDIVGQPVTLHVALADNSDRYFNGFVSRFAQSGADSHFTHYHMEVVPWLWFLTRIADCRIFQNMTIPNIIQQVFKSRGYSNFKVSLTGTYETREYCVQYRETDFNFVSRLMEQYGIFYFFQHESGKHTMVLADSSSAHQSCPGQKKAHYNTATGAAELVDSVKAWNIEQELRSGKYSLTDYNFETPSTSLMTYQNTVVDLPNNTKYEIYDYPGDYANKSQGTSVAKTRIEEEETSHLVVSGSSNCRAFTSGYKFDLDEHYRDDMNASYVLTEVQHVASAGATYISGGATGAASYSNHFTCIPDSISFRPARVTRRPFVQGPQTALVVGKSGEEIWVDKYGRVTVQFYWDRQGKKNENSSCWIRVSQGWAGQGWGAMWIPRIGQEVIVSFLEGDPDRPIITGRVYNAEQSVPYALPDNQTRSTYMSRSSKGGSSANYNEIRFEDKMGSEQVFVNAEKDMDVNVENDSREAVGNNRSLIITKDQMESVGGDRHEKVTGAHNEEIDGTYSLKVTGSNNQKIGGSMSLDIGATLNEKTAANFAHEAGQIIHLKAGTNVVIESGVEMTLKAGSNFINLSPQGIAISGQPFVMINSGGAAGSGPGSSPQSPTAPTKPDQADDGSKGTKLS